MDGCFRPLDGESFSKLTLNLLSKGYIHLRFRPLDGESFSKPVRYLPNGDRVQGFRPLDGESFSKLQHRR